MTDTITISAETWAELKAGIAALEALWNIMDGRQASEWTADELMDKATSAGYMGYDLCEIIAEVDDANTRAAYMALAADDQLPLFAGALE